MAEEGGALKAAITHDKDVVWSMHKKKNAKNVLGGEMLLTFYKPKTPVRLTSTTVNPVSLDELLDRFLPTLPTAGFRTEVLFNKLTIAAWEQHSLENLAVDAAGMAAKLQSRGWDYDAERHIWSRHPRKASSELTLVG